MFVFLDDRPFIVLLLHVVLESALPIVPSGTVIGDEEKYKNITFIDVAYTKEKGFYNCKMNKKAKEQLEKHFKPSNNNSFCQIL